MTKSGHLPLTSCAALLALTLLPSGAGAQTPAGEAIPLEAYCSAGPDAQPTGEARAALARGEQLLLLGQAERAADAFCAALRGGAAEIGAHERLRRALIAQRKSEGMAALTAKLGQLYLAAGDRELANRRLDELVTLSPEHPARAVLERALGRVAVDRSKEQVSIWNRLRSLLGIAAFLGIAVLLSNNRKHIDRRIVAWGLGLQLIFAGIILWTPPGKLVFDAARTFISKLLSFTDAGASFLFGRLYAGMAPSPTSGPMQIIDGTSGDYVNLGLVFAFHVLPTIIFFGALMSVLYHLGVMQKIVRGVAWVMTKSMGTSGSESLSAASNIFLGQTEAPLVVKPYLPRMTMSEIMAIMTGGFATVAGGVLAAYVRFGIDAGHLLAASVMNAPAALVMAKIIFPETNVSETRGGAVLDPEKTTSNVIDAAASGAGDGLRLAANVAAMLIAFIALIAMLNFGLGFLGGFVGLPDLSLGSIFGVLFYPLSWLMGVDMQDLVAFGKLIGIKLSINEFVAYVELSALQSSMTQRSFTIATYALCGFANFASIGIQIGGISGIAPSRRADLAKLGLRAMLAGAMASAMSACIAGLLV